MNNAFNIFMASTLGVLISVLIFYWGFNLGIAWQETSAAIECVKEVKFIDRQCQPKGTEVIPTPKAVEELKAEVTAYSSTPDQTDSTPFITASGSRVRKGIVACPRRLEFGTKVEIQGKMYTCEDRMAIKYDGNFDIWMPTRSQALQFGRQILQVKIY